MARPDIGVTMSIYEQNRSHFSLEELRQYRGKWVAFSSDGSRVIASSDDIGELNDLVVAAGVNPEIVGIERIVIADDDAFLGGIEIE